MFFRCRGLPRYPLKLFGKSIKGWSFLASHRHIMWIRPHCFELSFGTQINEHDTSHNPVDGVDKLASRCNNWWRSLSSRCLLQRSHHPMTSGVEIKHSNYKQQQYNTITCGLGWGCVSAVFAVARCPSVCLSVRLSRSCIVARRLKISSNFFLGR